MPKMAAALKNRLRRDFHSPSVVLFRTAWNHTEAATKDEDRLGGNKHASAAFRELCRVSASHLSGKMQLPSFLAWDLGNYI